MASVGAWVSMKSPTSTAILFFQMAFTEKKVASLVGIVDHVVVYQRCGVAPVLSAMRHGTSGLQPHGPREHLGRQKDEHGTHLFAFASDDVVKYPVQKGHAGGHGFTEFLLEGFHFDLYRPAYYFYCSHILFIHTILSGRILPARVVCSVCPGKSSRPMTYRRCQICRLQIVHNRSYGITRPSGKLSACGGYVTPFGQADHNGDSGILQPFLYISMASAEAPLNAVAYAVVLYPD